MAGGLKKAMVYLGSAEDNQELHSAPSGMSHLRRVPHPKQQMSEIFTFHPKKYSEVSGIVERLRQNIPVIIDMSQLSDTDARRMIDFASGLSQGLVGKIERVVGKVFLLSPEHISISTESKKEE